MPSTKIKTKAETATATRPRATAEQIERFTTGSFAYRVRQLMVGAVLPAHRNTPADLAAELAAHHAAGREIIKSLDAQIARIAEAVEAALDADAESDIAGAIETLREDTLKSAQAVVAWWAKANELAGRHAKALRPIMDEVQSKVKPVVDEVKADLNRIGSGVATMPGSDGANLHLAETMFDKLARNNTRARKVIADAQDASAIWNEAADRVHATARGLEAARKFLQNTAVAAVARAY
jgi:hypothetical protein